MSAAFWVKAPHSGSRFPVKESIKPDHENSVSISFDCYSIYRFSGTSSKRLTKSLGFIQRKKYAESADAFEKLLKTQPPHARLLYQAVLSNYSANRRGRARQLCQYIITNFGTTREAQFCKKLFPEPASTTKSEPEKKPEEKPKEDDKKVAQKKKTDDNDEDDEDDEEKEKATAKFTIDKNAKKGTLAFTPQQIAKDGASGIDQTINPNCWFEASVSALAELPRGQRLLASMIKIDSDDTYLVRFPGDGVEYKITELDLKRVGVKDKAL